MPIPLSSRTEALLVRVAAQEGLDPEEWLLAVLNAQELETDPKRWWDNLTEAAQKEEIAAVRQGIEDMKAGRMKPLSQVVAEARMKHSFPSSWLARLDATTPDADPE
jgi:hypothetical protein